MNLLKAGMKAACVAFILLAGFEANAATKGEGSYVQPSPKCESGSSHKGCKYSNPPGTKYRKHKTK